MVKIGDATVLHSGELARATGVSPDTIRHYERIGVLPRAARTASGYREYPAAAAERVLVVQQAIRIGFTLSELAEVLQTRDHGGVPCRRVYALAQRKLERISAEITALKRTQRYLTKVLAEWEQQLHKTGRGKKAHLLQALRNAPLPPGGGHYPYRRRSL